MKISELLDDIRKLDLVLPESSASMFGLKSKQSSFWSR
jgi:hypothetical protein